MKNNKLLTLVSALVLLFSVPFSSIVAQERTANNSIFAEGLGNGLFYSLNYERMIIDDIAVRVGFGRLSIGSTATSGGVTVDNKVSLTTIPLSASYLGIGNKKHSLELGAGTTLAFVSASVESDEDQVAGSVGGTFITTTIGYRLQPVDGGFQFRVGFNGNMAPGAGGIDADGKLKWGFLPWGYLSLGGTFGK